MNVVQGAEIVGDGAKRFTFPAVPAFDVPPTIEEIDGGKNSTSAAYAELARTICRRLPTGSAVLGFTSPGEGDGKTRLLDRLKPELSRCYRGDVSVVAEDYWQLNVRRIGRGLTLVDMPSLDRVEAAGVARQCDGVFLVVRLGHTPRCVMKESVRALHAVGTQYLGCIVVE